ncbi:hypothetical protein BC941DRAFT_363907, partial [Chlamydoabsidia padenii]
PPIVVEVQQNVNHKFVGRAFHYCLNILKETDVLPILAVFNVDGFVGKAFCDKTFTIGQGPYYTCEPFIYNLDSIADHLALSPLDPIVALTRLLTGKQRHLLALDEYDDPTLQLIYSAAYYSFTKHHNLDANSNTNLINFCDVACLPFEKIIKTISSEPPTTSNKRANKCAEDGILFAKRMKYQCQESTSADVTPI